MTPFRISPSLLSADFSNLRAEILSIEQAGADALHLDVMDGHFVPNLTFGPLLVSAIRPHTRLSLDCHLMVSQPENWIEEFSKAGATGITVHAEATLHLDRLLHQVRDSRCQVGVSLNPATPVAVLENVLHLVDRILIMSVNPGFGGQAFIPQSLDKIRALEAMRGKHRFAIQVDGGVGPHNLQTLAEAGATDFVMGSAVFGAKDRARAIQDCRAVLAKVSSV